MLDVPTRVILLVLSASTALPIVSAADRRSPRAWAIGLGVVATWACLFLACLPAGTAPVEPAAAAVYERACIHRSLWCAVMALGFGVVSFALFLTAGRRAQRWPSRGRRN